MSEDIKKLFADKGFPYPDNLIMAFIGGSTQHGAIAEELACHDPRHGDPCFHVDGKRCQACAEEGCPEVGMTIWTPSGGSDLDYYGVFIPPAHKTLGIDRHESFSYPPQAVIDKRSRGNRIPGDMDIALHSLQKWAGMAATGNPTVLSFLFAKIEYGLCDIERQGDVDNVAYYNMTRPYYWGKVLENSNLFISKHHVWPFIKYAEAQMDRLLGLRGQKNVNRPDLEAKYGYDTKYAMHIVRLLVEGRELMETGKITYPNLKVDLLKEIRRGKHPIEDILKMFTEFKADAIRAAHQSQLPDNIDRDKISRLIADIHLEFYANIPTSTHP